jgi:hypothetical protein
MTTPSHIQHVAREGSCPALSSTLSSDSRSKSIDMKLTTPTGGGSSTTRVRLSSCVAERSTSNTFTPASSDMRQARPS